MKRIKVQILVVLALIAVALVPASAWMENSGGYANNVLQFPLRLGENGYEGRWSKFMVDDIYLTQRRNLDGWLPTYRILGSACPIGTKTVWMMNGGAFANWSPRAEDGSYRFQAEAETALTIQTGMFTEDDGTVHLPGNGTFMAQAGSFFCNPAQPPDIANLWDPNGPPVQFPLFFALDNGYIETYFDHNVVILKSVRYDDQSEVFEAISGGCPLDHETVSLLTGIPQDRLESRSTISYAMTHGDPVDITIQSGVFIDGNGIVHDPYLNRSFTATSGTFTCFVPAEQLSGQP